jgi:hypothetical protein
LAQSVADENSDHADAVSPSLSWQAARWRRVPRARSSF